MKPIHKFNGSLGATLCHQCSVIITTELTDDLYCKECKDHRKKLLIEIMKEDEDLGLYIEQMEKEESEQETLEEAAERLYSDKEYSMYGEIRRHSFIAGAKWQQEQDKNKYSEEEVRKISLDFFYHWWNSKGTNTEQGFDKWFEQIKKK
jgi:hypothetical protein